MRAIRSRRALLALVVAAMATAAPVAGREARTGPSGLPVPRWISLKFDRVNARAGPGDDHRLLWVYRVRGLPVQVIQETADWRRVCDPDGGLAWVHKRVTDGRRTAMNLNDRTLPLAAQPQGGAETRALWNRRSLGELERCRGGWCQIKVAGQSGWVRRDAVWGGREGPVCRRPG